MGEIAGTGFLLKALGIGVIPGVAMLVFLVVTAVLKFIGKKADKDRAEHMEKWNSMIALQDKVIESQKEIVKQIVTGNREDLDRMYQLYKEQGDSLKVLAHNVSTIATVIDRKSFCPNDLKGGKQ